ncbi:phragmoplast orienting kinesin 2 [Chlorella sorokiniana]|uniref:Phragmoplast orienting kinesin 2 n=1 Tax=Chlorella sorokiniana TaxID=3076 RepID=A0A2P6TIF5_CHLSO|nr:phragmoplast orienting kinesin 2 [Chlorella sorokiniana]|eukprot:PRW34071.1 phragmoplast orienting kinesin 2 [Chlorella sorokiniana]
MRLKDRIAQAFSGSGKKSGGSARRGVAAAEENASPLVPKRLLTPGGALPGSARPRPDAGLRDLTASGTPRALNYDGSASPAPSRLQREPSLQRTPAGPRLVRPGSVAPTTGRTPAQPSRFSQPPPSMGHDSAAAAMAADPDGTALSSDNIRVVLRVRPRNERETLGGGGICVQPLSAATVRVASHPEPHNFSFDYVAGDGTSQETIFKVAGKPIVDNCLAGYNGCIFAYGQTGSGKTYTMLGSDETAGEWSGAPGRDEARGLIQRVFEHLFARMAEAGGKHLLECSFLEIYNETITDLLDPSRTNLHVRENLEGQYVSNLSAHECSRVEDVVQLLRMGQANRRTGETNMNERSSRSHSVFTCKLQSKTLDQFGTSHVRTSRLHLVDLAGSERQKASGAQGERLKEATAINKSLSALGNVIMSLVDQQHGRSRHIPYRDSRLTYLLQDSLGGNAKTCLVATVSPASINMAETLSTLRFADQAKRIKNQAVVNEDTDGDRAALKREIKRLNEELAAARRQLAAGPQQHHLGGAAATSSGFAAPGPVAGEPQSGTPARLHAQADALLSATSPTMEGMGRRQALISALRREDAAVKDVKRLEAELEGMRGLLKAKDSDLQRTVMMMKLKESRLARLNAGGGGDVPAEVAELQQELELLRAKVDSHPEVKRFAVENIRLAEELKKVETILNRQELAALHHDVDGLRGELLRLEDEWRHAQDEMKAAQKAAEAARSEAEASADSIRAQAAAEAQAKAAIELAALRQQLFEQQRAAREAEGALQGTAGENEELQARVALLQETVATLEGSQAELRGELSPLKRQARHLESELDLARQTGQAAEMRATSEHTLRSQAELAASAAATRVAALEAEAASLRTANHELFRAKSFAEEQRDSAAGMGMELAALQAQLEREQAAAAERQAEHANTQANLDASQQRVATLEGELATSQRETGEARQELQRTVAAHEAETSAAAARITAALKAATDMQAELESRAACLRELQAAQEKLQSESDDLNQRCTQLHNENTHLGSMLAQRDNELQEMEQTIEEKDGQLAAQKEAADKLAEELKEAQAALAVRGNELAAATAELEATRSKLADATAAMQDAHEQLSELQDRLSAAEVQQAELEYDMSDKSASLREASEQLSALKRQLAESRAAAEAASAKAEAAAAELEQSHVRAMGLATSLAELEGELEGRKAEAGAHEEALAAARAEAEAQRAEAEAQRAQAEKQRAEVEAARQALAAVQQGTLLEKEQQIILGRAELAELRAQLAEQEEAAAKLRSQLEARDAELREAKAAMATEVAEAAQQVQHLLAANCRVDALEAELAAVRGELQAAQREAEEAHHLQPGAVAEVVAAARADARRELDRLEQLLAQKDEEVQVLRQELDEVQAEVAEAATLTTAQAQEQINQLIAEREAWIEEVTAQRAEATAAIEASRALERRHAEVAEERQALSTAFEAEKERCTKLEDELTHLTGQQNLNQRIQYHKKIKDENGSLREELGRLRIEAHRTQVRFERVQQELQRLRAAAGQEAHLPDFDAEEALREALAATEARKAQLEAELVELSHSVVALAGGSSGAASSAAGPAESGVIGRADDIVLELGTPRPGAAGTGMAGGSGGPAGASEASTAARRALADLSAQQAAAARSLEDQRQQIRLLQESKKLARMRRASAVPAAQQ